MKICVIMFYDDNIKSYADINYNINKKYCEKNNLEIIISNKKIYTYRSSHWERLPLLLNNISNFEYLVWIDADAFFYYDSSNIVDIINNNMNVNFIFSNDIGNNNINSGFFIVKNSKYSIDFLTIWAYDDELFKISQEKKRWNDQELLIHMYDNNILDIKTNSIIFDYGILQHFYENDKLNKPYIFHLAGRNSETRYEISKKYFDTFFV